MGYKKSQIQTQVFIYIISTLIFVFILVYGYNAIKGFGQRSEQIAYIKFKTDMVSTVKRISPDFGTVKKEEFFIGGDYTRVCFVQSYNPPPNLARVIEAKGDPIVRDSVQSGVNKNAFLFTNTLQESLDIGKISTTIDDNGYLCIPVKNGKVKVQFLGKGDHTEISAW